MKRQMSLLCPSRGRPDEAKRLHDSAYETATDPNRIELLFYIDNDDPTLLGYQMFFPEHMLVVGEPISVSKSWNILAEKATGDLLLMTNDDQIYRTRSWDVVLDEHADRFPDDIFCLFFDDGLCHDAHCAFPIMSRRWYETLGYFTPGIFEFLFNDTWIMDIAKRIDRLHYIGEVLVEHMHVSCGKSPMDATYERHMGTHMIDGDRYSATANKRHEEAAKLLAVIASYVPAG